MTIESIELLAQEGYDGPPPPLAFKEGKGHVSVNPTYGCRIGCPFCISQADPWQMEGSGCPPWNLATPEWLVEELARNASAVAPLRLSLLDFTDPFTPSLEPTLRTLLTGLAKRLSGQAVLLTTRLAPQPGLLDLMMELNSALHLSLFVSLGDATGNIPPATPVPPRLELLRESARRGLHTVMLLRPIAREWVRGSTVLELLKQARDTCHEVVLGGLRAPETVENSLERAGWPRPAYRSRAGEVEPRLRDRIVSIAEKSGVLPVSEHRSCAFNRFHEMSCLVAGRSTHAVRRPNDVGDSDRHLRALEPVLCDFFDATDSPVPRVGTYKCDLEQERCRVDRVLDSKRKIVARPCELGPPTCHLDVSDSRGRSFEVGPCGIGSDRCTLDVGSQGTEAPHQHPCRALNVRDRDGYCRLKIAA